MMSDRKDGVVGVREGSRFTNGCSGASAGCSCEVLGLVILVVKWNFSRSGNIVRGNKFRVVVMILLGFWCWYVWRFGENFNNCGDIVSGIGRL